MRIDGISESYEPKTATREDRVNQGAGYGLEISCICHLYRLAIMLARM